MSHLSTSMALASVTASTVSSSASKSSTATSARKAPPTASQNWRGKYLRALNISTPEVDVTRKRAALASSASSSSLATGTASQQQQQLMRRARSCRTMAASRDAGDSAMRGMRSRRQQLLQRQSASAEYGFAVKPDLARGRRCHTAPVVVADDKVSAPIEIPCAVSGFAGTAKLSDITNLDTTDSSNSSRRFEHRSADGGLDNQRGKLLSWEDPVAMLGAAPTTTTTASPKAGRVGGLDIAFSQILVSDRFGVAAASSENEFFCDEFVEDPEDDEAECSDSDNNDSDDDDQIFEMEDFENDKNSSNNNDDESSSSRSRLKSGRSRRQRTASLSTATSPSSRAAALPRFHSARHMRCPPSSASELPESFVPPHKLVQRDVFSLGLRDKFKRRPAKI